MSDLSQERKGRLETGWFVLGGPKPFVTFACRSDPRARSISTLDVMIRHGQFRFPPRKLGIHDVERGRDGGDGGYRDNDMEKSRLICFFTRLAFLAMAHTDSHTGILASTYAPSCTHARKCLAH